MPNETLATARQARNDEFYTQYYDIENEMNAYLDFDPNVFRGKKVLLPCDADWSNFTLFFAQKFHDLGLNKLTTTCICPNALEGTAIHPPTTFIQSSPKFNDERFKANGLMFTIENDINGDGTIDIKDLQWNYLNGNGDFSSNEVSKLRDEADIIVTNPPFSLFRKFLAWLIESNKKFIIIGNMNAISYKEVFPLIMNNKIWLGVTNGSKDYNKPDGTIQTMGNTCWFTNIEHGWRHQPMQFMTMSENLKFGKLNRDSESNAYTKYDNYDAIEIPYTYAIPSDYNGIMGVPISFLNKYCPEQFEIVGITKTWFGGATKTYPKQIQVDKNGKQTLVTKLNDGATIELEKEPTDSTFYIVDGKYYIQMYARILIKHKR